MARLNYTLNRQSGSGRLGTVEGATYLKSVKKITVVRGVLWYLLIPMSQEIQLVLLATVVGSALFLLLLALMFHYRKQSQQLEEQAAEIRPLTQKMLRVEQELQFIVQFLREIPHLTGELNTPKQRIIPEALVNILVRVFHPEQAVILIRRRSTVTDPDRDRQLTVAAVHAPSPTIKSGVQINIGDGELGYLAEAQDVLERRDFENRSGSIRSPSKSGLATMRVDLGSRMAIGEEVLGVMAVSRPQKKQTHSKEVLRLIAQMGAFALSHASERDFIQSVADVDPLTEIFNKGVLTFRLGELIYAAEQEKRRLAVFIFDIDHFKNYNDKNGHVAGDELLKMLVRVCKDQIRQDDIFGRFGGEEFLLILPDRSASEAYIVGEKIRMAIESYEFRHGKKQPMGRLTISGGVAAYPETGSDSTELLQRADEALYAAKNSGRNRIVVAPQKTQIGAQLA
jgi:diguanylate cyclase (GGDEF)-like protein